MFIQGEDGIWAQADARVFAGLMAANRTNRRLMSAERTMAGARKRVAALRQRIESAAAMASAKAAAEIEREFQQSSPGWGRTFRVKVKPLRTIAGAGRRAAAAVKNGKVRRTLRAYKAPLVDAQGRTAIFFRVRYKGLKSKGWRPGLAADHALYILREEALEAASGEVPISNMGEAAAEIAAAWRTLEAVEEGYRANATVQYRIIWNLPHFLGAEARREMVEQFCERTFARFGLPYVAAVHKPDPSGDERNWHAHICFSTRPMERMATGEWLIAEEKVNGLTDAAGLLAMRAQAAEHMNMACRRADLAPRFTHLSYRARGIDAARQEHVGPIAMAAHERGEAVGAIERNAAIVEMNELGAEHAKAEREVALAGRLSALLGLQVDIAARRRALAAKTAVVRTAAQRASGIASRLSMAVPQPIRAERVMNISQRAAAMVRAIQNRPKALPIGHRTDVRELGRRTRQIASDIGGGLERRDTMATADRQLQSARRAATEHRMLAEQKLACRVIAEIQPPPYRIENGRVVLDVTSMAAADRALVLALENDNDVVSAELRRRINADRDREVADLREWQARQEAEHRQAAQRQVEIEDACRILAQSPTRPYRWIDGRIELDLSALNDDRERQQIKLVISAPEVTETLLARAKRDRDAEATRRQADELCATLDQAVAKLDGDRRRVLEQRRSEAEPVCTTPDATDGPDEIASAKSEREIVKAAGRDARSPVAMTVPREPAQGVSGSDDGTGSLVPPGRATTLPNLDGKSTPPPLSNAQKAIADSALSSIAQNADFISAENGRLRIMADRAKDVALDDALIRHAYVQERLRPLWEAQERDLDAIFEAITERPEYFEFRPGASRFMAGAPEALLEAFARRDTPYFQRLLTQVITSDPELEQKLERARQIEAAAEQKERETPAPASEQPRNVAAEAAFRFRGGWER